VFVDNIFATCRIHGELTRDQVHRRGKNLNGTYRWRCKNCGYALRLKWMAENKDKVKKQQNKYDSTNKKRTLYRWKRYLYKNFNLTIEQYKKMFLEQNNTCLICKKHESRLAYKKNIKAKLCVDHCHKTGKIRGLLCWRCNGLLGMAQDTIPILEEAINYLKNHA
jgi:hypothetical protein